MKWAHDVKSMVVDPPARVNAVPSDLWGHMIYAHGWDGQHLNIMGGIAAAAAHVLDHEYVRPQNSDLGEQK